MGFQPDTTIDGLYIVPPSLDLGNGFYSVDGLTEDPAGSGLFAFDVGDFAYPVLTPIPHVEMTIFELDDATETITLFRTVGRRTMPVRGMFNAYARGGVNVVDWEAPFGVTLTYWAEQYDADGNFIGNTTPSSTQLDVAQTWIHNPLDPAGAVEVRLARGAAAKIPRPQDGDVDWADGAGIGTVTTGQRHGVVDTPVIFYVLTDADSDKVNDILGDPYTVPSGPSIVCIRPASHENTRWPQPFIAWVALEEYPVSQPAGGQITRWDGTGTEVEPPAVALVAAVLTYDDLDEAFASYDAMDAAYGSYLERDRDYNLAGAGGGTPGSGTGSGGGTTPGGESGSTPIPLTNDTTYGAGPYGSGPYGS